jgi:8-oxo-dGTP pyrophosphatase MutT (NUDIX family)
MLHLIARRFVPAPLHRLILNIVHDLRVIWWRRANRPTRDCRAVAIDGEGRVLLVLHSYGNYGWMAPGGKPDRGEDPVAAATRELFEETGVVLVRGIEVMHPDPGAHRCNHVVVGEARGEPKADGREILEARFCKLEALPEPVSERREEQLRGWITRYRELTRPTCEGGARPAKSGT